MFLNMPAVPNKKIKFLINELYQEGNIKQIDFRVFKSFSYYVCDPSIEYKLYKNRLTEKILNVGMGDLKEGLKLANEV